MILKVMYENQQARGKRETGKSAPEGCSPFIRNLAANTGITLLSLGDLI